MRILNTLNLLNIAILGAHAMKNISSKELVKNLKIGWNLGNTLDAQCIDSLNYSNDQTASETCWGNVKTTKALYTKLGSLGFNTFRIPTTWSGHFGSGPQYKINEVWMKRVHEVVDYALSTGGYAILNVHHETWNHAFSNNLASAKPILVALWKQIAAEFSNYDEHLIFEGMNEPRKIGTSVEWTGGDQEGWNFVNEMNELFVKTIRATGGNNALRHLMIPTYAASVSENALNNFKFPSGDDKLIVSLHSYSPYNFALNTGGGSTSSFNDASELDSIFSNINNKFISKNIPVIIGEFGAISRNNEEERAKWGKYYLQKAGSIGVPCVLWDNGIFQGNGETFGVIDRSSLNVVYPTFVNSLISASGANTSNNNGNATTTTTTKKASTTTTTKKASTKITTTKKVTTTTTKTKVVTKTTTTTTKANKTTDKPTTETNSSIDYYSCKANDYDCKRSMSEKCYMEAAKCWSAYKGVGDECSKINEKCAKIWS